MDKKQAIIIAGRYVNAIKSKFDLRKALLFGSFAKGTTNENSDIDLLVEFDEDSEYGLLDMARMERELSEIIGKKVDLRTPAELSKYFRDAVVKEAKIKYEG